MYMGLSPPVLGLVTIRNKNKPKQVEGNRSNTTPEKVPLSLLRLIFCFGFCLSKTCNVQQMAKGNLEFEFLQLINKMDQGCIGLQGSFSNGGCGRRYPLLTYPGQLTVQPEAWSPCPIWPATQNWTKSQEKNFCIYTTYWLTISFWN